MDARVTWNSEGGVRWNHKEMLFTASSVPGLSSSIVNNENGAEQNGADRYSSHDNVVYVNNNSDNSNSSNNNNNNPQSSDEPNPNEVDDDDDGEVDGSSCYLCTQCGKGFTTERELESHILTVHELDDEEEETEDTTMMTRNGNDDSTFVDDEAETNDGDAKSSSSPSYQRHQYACKLCPRTFSVSSALNVHYTHTHKDKPQYDCELCGRAFTVKRELATHKRMHEGQPTHKCRQCGKEFGTKQLLRKHELWHTGERSHVCPQCGKAFFQKGHLTQHLMIHAGGRPHVCVLCQKTFIFKFDLNRHMKIHAERLIVAANGSATTTDVNSIVNNNNNNDSSPPADANSISTNNPFNGANKAQENNNNFSLSADDIVQLLSSSPSTNSAITPMFRRRSNNNGRHSLHAVLMPPAAVSPKNEERFAVSPSSYDKNGIVISHHSNILMNSAMVAMNHNGHDLHNNHTTRYEDRNEISPANSVSSTSVSSSLLGAGCDQCSTYKSDLESAQRRMDDLKMLLEERNQEIEALKNKVHHVGRVTSNLLETCSDFDKLWMLHSKKVYSQIQNVLNALE